VPPENLFWVAFAEVTVVVAGGAAAPEDLAAVCLPVNLCLGKAVLPTALAAQFPTLALIE
jgi:hypothetical protein